MYHNVAVIQQDPLGLSQPLLAQAITPLFPKAMFQLRRHALDVQTGTARGYHEYIGDTHGLPHPKQHDVGGVLPRQKICDQPSGLERLY